MMRNKEKPVRGKKQRRKEVSVSTGTVENVDGEAAAVGHIHFHFGAFLFGAGSVVLLMFAYFAIQLAVYEGLL